jgi:hypothetical protein
MTTHTYGLLFPWRIPGPILHPWNDLPALPRIALRLTIDQRRLEEAAGVKIDENYVDRLFGVVKFYFEHRDNYSGYNDYVRRLLKHRKTGRPLSVSAQVQLRFFDIFVERCTYTNLTAPQWRALLLRTTIALLQGLWHHFGGSGEGTAHYRKLKDHGAYGGRLIYLFQELCKQLDVPEPKRPRPRTLHRARLAWSRIRDEFSVPQNRVPEWIEQIEFTNQFFIRYFLGCEDCESNNFSALHPDRLRVLC